MKLSPFFLCLFLTACTEKSNYETQKFQAPEDSRVLTITPSQEGTHLELIADSIVLAELSNELSIQVLDCQWIGEDLILLATVDFGELLLEKEGQKWSQRWQSFKIRGDKVIRVDRSSKNIRFAIGEGTGNPVNGLFVEFQYKDPTVLDNHQWAVDWLDDKNVVLVSNLLGAKQWEYVGSKWRLKE